MKVTWEDSDMRAGTKVRKELNCMVCSIPGDHLAPAALIVLENGRLMFHGSKQELAEYMNNFEYLPGWF